MREKYFEYRNVGKEFYSSYNIPGYLERILPPSLNANILEIGCGLGQMLGALAKRGYKNSTGIDILTEAVSYCLKNNLSVHKVDSIEQFCEDFRGEKFDFIIMTHVLEHLGKSTVIETLQIIRTKLLEKQGQLFVTVPNAQSNTGCYWAYEDFTHQTIYTTGSVYYVLKAAGFENIKFIDPDCTEGLSLAKKIVRKLLLALYKINKQFWNRATSSSFHRPSLQVFSFELKVLAS